MSARSRDPLLTIEINIVTGEQLITPPPWMSLEDTVKLRRVVAELSIFTDELRSAVV